jgi:hypothetical protein
MCGRRHWRIGAACYSSPGVAPSLLSPARGGIRVGAGEVIGCDVSSYTGSRDTYAEFRNQILQTMGGEEPAPAGKLIFVDFLAISQPAH